MHTRKIGQYLGAAGMLLLWGNPAQAQLSFAFVEPTVSGTAGQRITFSANFANTGDDDLFLDKVCFSLPNELTYDDTKFFVNVPYPIAPGGQPGSLFTGEIFDIAIDPLAAPGIYNGVFTIECGYDGDPDHSMTEQNFQVVVTAAPTAVPEPGVLSLMAAGALGVGMLHRRRRFRA